MRYFYDKDKKRLLCLDDQGQSIYSLFELTDPGGLITEINVTNVHEVMKSLKSEASIASVVRIPIPKTYKERRKTDDIETKEGGPSSKTMRVKELFDQGMTDKEIAAELGLGTPAVSYHKKKLGLTKMNLPSRKEEEVHDLSTLPDPDSDSDPLSLGDEENLVVEIRSKWIVDKMPVPTLLRELNISMRRFAWLCQKYGLKRE